MKGHVPTPPGLADDMVEMLFEDNEPEQRDRILYPGSGEGPFIAAVKRYCERNGKPMPEGAAVETHPDRIETAKSKHREANVEFLQRDFLGDLNDLDEFDYIVSNPPYVPIEDLDEGEKRTYKSRFETAVGRFDLYILFFEQSLNLLADGGRLVFVTPEKFEYVETASPLRRIMTNHHVKSIDHIDEDSFSGYITFPTVTTIDAIDPGRSRIKRRDGSEEVVSLPEDGSAWTSILRTEEEPEIDSGVTLGDICERISCGVATGDDKLFVESEEEAPQQLRDDWTYPTVSGKQLGLNDNGRSDSVFICPYDENGDLPAEDELGDFGDWAEVHRSRLEDRSCVKKNKRPWYGWHENPPMEDILQEKILTQDIAEEPHFWLDKEGDIVPRHTVYYLIPKDHVNIEELLEYLNGPEAAAWLKANCQRAHNDYYRFQSRVMKELPVPEEFGETVQKTLV